MEEARFTLRIHPILMNKMKRSAGLYYNILNINIAKSNGRSVNKEIEQILKWVIDDYERKCGRIALDDDEMPKSKTDIKPAPDNPMDMLFKIEK